MGDKLEMAQYVWGENVRQLLDNSTTRLALQKPAKFIFTLDGKLVHRVILVWCLVFLFLCVRLLSVQ